MALKLIEVRQAASVDDVERDNVVMFEARVHYSLSGEPSIVPCLNPPGPFKATWVEEKTVRQLAVIPMPVATANMMQWIHSHPPVSKLFAYERCARFLPCNCVHRACLTSNAQATVQ